jgi:hypothetical protein
MQELGESILLSFKMTFFQPFFNLSEKNRLWVYGMEDVSQFGFSDCRVLHCQPVKPTIIGQTSSWKKYETSRKIGMQGVSKSK